MVAVVINGKDVAAGVVAKIKTHAQRVRNDYGVQPGLAVIIVGDDPASHTYVASKSRMANECGFHSVQHTLPAATSEADLISLIMELNEDRLIHGILVQLPLPQHLNSSRVIQSILPEKDVDGLHVVNAGKVASGDLDTALVSCTPAGAMKLVQRIHGDDLSGLNALVIGRSNLFGKPMAALLLAANATVTTAHSRTRDLPLACRNADLLVAAVGSPEMVKARWVKPGATIIDVGINRVPLEHSSDGKTRLVGDVDFDECAAVADAITPVPGGVGPMTIAMLMANTLKATCVARGLSGFDI